MKREFLFIVVRATAEGCGEALGPWGGEGEGETGGETGLVSLIYDDL